LRRGFQPISRPWLRGCGFETTFEKASLTEAKIEAELAACNEKHRA